MKYSVEQYQLNPLKTDCCAQAGKAAGSIRLCLELFVTFASRQKTKEKRESYALKNERKILKQVQEDRWKRH